MRLKLAPGLTMVEILIILAELGVLVAILLPVFTVTHGCGASCADELRKLGQAARLYAQDWDDTLFWNPAPGGLPADQKAGASRANGCAPQPATSFVLLLYPYTKGPWAFWCPRQPGYDADRHLGYARSLRKAALTLRPENPTWIHRLGYGFNEVLVADPCHPRTLASLKHRPEQVALFADAARPWASGTDAWVRTNGRWTRYWTWNRAETLRHGRQRDGQPAVKGQNFLYMDGSVRFGAPISLGGEGSDRGYFPRVLLE